ncbi:hypothetical protein ACNKHN_07990 [Shigella flexneri]
MAVGLDWALVVDHQRQTVSLLSHNECDAHGLAGKQRFSPQKYTLTSDWQSNMTREQYGKNRQVRNICTAVIAISDLWPSVFMRPILAMNGRHS